MIQWLEEECGSTSALLLSLPAIAVTLLSATNSSDRVHSVPNQDTYDDKALSSTGAQVAPIKPVHSVELDEDILVMYTRFIGAAVSVLVCVAEAGLATCTDATSGHGTKASTASEGAAMDGGVRPGEEEVDGETEGGDAGTAEAAGNDDDDETFEVRDASSMRPKQGYSKQSRGGKKNSSTSSKAVGGNALSDAQKRHLRSIGSAVLSYLMHGLVDPLHLLMQRLVSYLSPTAESSKCIKGSDALAVSLSKACVDILAVDPKYTESGRFIDEFDTVNVGSGYRKAPVEPWKSVRMSAYKVLRRLYLENNAVRGSLLTDLTPLLMQCYVHPYKPPGRSTLHRMNASGGPSSKLDLFISSSHIDTPIPSLVLVSLLQSGMVHLSPEPVRGVENTESLEDNAAALSTLQRQCFSYCSYILRMCEAKSGDLIASATHTSYRTLVTKLVKDLLELVPFPEFFVAPILVECFVRKASIDVAALCGWDQLGDTDGASAGTSQPPERSVLSESCKHPGNAMFSMDIIGLIGSTLRRIIAKTNCDKTASDRNQLPGDVIATLRAVYVDKTQGPSSTSRAASDGMHEFDAWSNVARSQNTLTAIERRLDAEAAVLGVNTGSSPSASKGSKHLPSPSASKRNKRPSTAAAASSSERSGHIGVEDCLEALVEIESSALDLLTQRVAPSDQSPMSPQGPAPGIAIAPGTPRSSLSQESNTGSGSYGNSNSGNSSAYNSNVDVARLELVDSVVLPRLPDLLKQIGIRNDVARYCTRSCTYAYKSKVFDSSMYSTRILKLRT
jgi:hypothetical protein